MPVNFTGAVTFSGNTTVGDQSSQANTNYGMISNNFTINTSEVQDDLIKKINALIEEVQGFHDSNLAVKDFVQQKEPLLEIIRNEALIKENPGKLIEFVTDFGKKYKSAVESVRGVFDASKTLIPIGIAIGNLICGAYGLYN